MQIRDRNDEILEKIFTIASQFGDVPVIVAGDLQHQPMHYDSVSRAVNFHHWHDPLCVIDDDGSLTRPLTFSLDGQFSGAGDNCSSIDAILLNRVAFAALKHMSVVEISQVQHRPIKATFDWHIITQEGFVHVPPAKLKTAHLAKPDRNLETCQFTPSVSELWETKFSDIPENFDERWEQLNKFCLDVLISRGASWDKGAQNRGKNPIFQAKRICPGQLRSGSTFTLFLAKWTNALSKILELQIRLSRVNVSPQDWHQTRSTIRKVHAVLVNLQCPFVWQHETIPCLLTLHHVRIWLEQRIAKMESDAKHARISRWKNKMREASKGDFAHIYHHLKNKVQNDPPNLLEDDKGNIITQPTEAIDRMNFEWDDVFATNILRDQPTKVLRIIWPYIKNEFHPIELPPICAIDLFDTIHRRNPLAAPGLDGWRTTDIQALPVSALVPIANFFNELEACNEDIPNILTRAKQMVLNKNGSAEPMQKRLITILPVFLLMYTGTRFYQLREWQQLAMPSQLHGGIQKRQMSTVSNTLRVHIDMAHTTNEPVVGMKLDKTKCFDRLIPEYVGALFLSFGLPKNFVSFFLRIYRNLCRHMFFKGWASPGHTTSANGLAQGCSISLLAINCHMKVWICICRQLPGIFLAAFIDDSYLWTKLTNTHNLSLALEATVLWDSISGQHLNQSKSVIWGSSAAARKHLKQLFPDMLLLHEFDVLGTMIYTTDKNYFAFPSAKTHKILTDVRNIAVLPITNNAKSILIASKVVSQSSFAAGISKIPKKVLSKIQTEITNALWHKRPKWRSRWLVLAFLTKPHRVEPFLARAYITILDFLRFFHGETDLQPTLHCLALEDDLPAGAWITQVFQAFQCFGLLLDRQLKVSFHGSMKVHISQIAVKDIKTLLKYLATHMAYCRAIDSHRKDFVIPEGILDLDLTWYYYKNRKQSSPGQVPDFAFFENQLVGCSTTRDRLAAAKMVEDATCRFCGADKECLHHIVFQCDKVNDHITKPIDHELGPNFNSLGIVEHPFAIARHRLRVSDLPEPSLLEHFDPSCRVQLWTDGSILWGDCFWLTCGGCAVVNCKAEKVFTTSVQHWTLSSFTVEFFAVAAAFLQATNPVDIFTDCLTVVKLFNIILTGGKPETDWPLFPWWKKIVEVLESRRQIVQSPLEVTWIPSHTFDGIPFHLITQDMLAAKNTTLQHVMCNRVADLLAKEIAQNDAAVSISDRKWLLDSIAGRQKWLVDLNKRFGDDVLISKANNNVEPLIPEVCFQTMFPRWPWNAKPELYRTFKGLQNFDPPKKWKWSEDSWRKILRFVAALKWHILDGNEVAFVEFTFLFHKRGFRLAEIDPQTKSFRDLHQLMRIAMRSLHALGALPGKWIENSNKSWGRHLPTGCIQGAIPWFSFQELEDFANILLEGAGGQMQSWSFILAECTFF